MFHYTKETDKSVEQAVTSLEDRLKEAKFGVLWDFDIEQTLKDKGFEFDQSYRVLEVCNPKAAKEALEKNVMVGYFLPCKMVVYDDQGTTKVGFPKPTALISMLDDDSLEDFARDVENQLIKAVDESV